MGKVVKAVAGVALGVAGVITGNFALIAAGVSLVGNALLQPSRPSSDRAAAEATLQIGEQPRQAVLGKTAVAGSLVDAFNYGGDDATDWEVLVIALADHRCDALEGVLVDDTFHAFAADGAVSGFNNQLEVYWRDGQWDQDVPQILIDHGPNWTANDRGRGVAHVVVAYKADDPEAENPVWPGGRPGFRWVLRGARCYDARLDGPLSGGSGAHRADDPATWTWSENPIIARYNWVRGFFAGDRIDQPEMLLVGRGLSAVQAPPENTFARANLCDEQVNGAARYRLGGVVRADERFLEVEEDIAAACAGTIVQPEGAVEIDPGEARSATFAFTDDDLIVGRSKRWSDILGTGDDGWVNTVVASFVDPLQGWIERSAPPARVLADITADKGPRELQISLPMVRDIAQAGRVAEIYRRLGRLWGRGEVTLPPRFAAIEEGDWGTWQSDRHFGGATKTFRVEAWGSDEGWRHTLTLREIAPSVYTDVAPPADSAIAVQQPGPPALTAPGAAAWTLSAPSGSGPMLEVNGAIDNARASRIRIDFRPTGTTFWTSHGDFPVTATRLPISALAGATEYEVSVRYLVDDQPTPRRVIGPATTVAALGATGALTIISRSIAFPLSSNDDSVSIAAFNAVLSNGSTISFAAATLSSLASDTSYGVFWDLSASAYLTATSPALTQMANSGLVLIGTQRTSSGGNYTPPPNPPNGSGGDGTEPY